MDGDTLNQLCRLQAAGVEARAGKPLPSSARVLWGKVETMRNVVRAWLITT
jgi:hypothetical protein